MASEEPAGPSLCTQLCSATAAAENLGKALGMARVFHLQPALEERGITGSFPPPFPTSASGGTITTKREMDASLMAILHHALVPPQQPKGTTRPFYREKRGESRGEIEVGGRERSPASLPTPRRSCTPLPPSASRADRGIESQIAAGESSQEGGKKKKRGKNSSVSLKINK